MWRRSGTKAKGDDNATDESQWEALGRLRERWRIEDGATILLRPRGWRMSRGASLTAHLLLYVGGTMYLTVTITMVDVLTPFHLAATIITAIVLLLAMILQMQPVIDAIRLEPATFAVSWRGVLRPSEATMQRDRMTYAYADTSGTHEETQQRQLAIGYRGVAGPVTFSFPTDDDENKAFATLIRCYYQLPKFPPSASPEKDAYCPRCKYDMRGSARAGRFNCPECGTMMEPWQIESCKVLQQAADAP